MQPVCHQRTCMSIAGYTLLKGHLGRELQREQAGRWQIASPLARADTKITKKGSESQTQGNKGHLHSLSSLQWRSAVG